MGYYVYLGRPHGSEAPRAENIEEVLNRQDWVQLATKFDAERVDTWIFSMGFIELVRKPPKSNKYEAPWLYCRVSWGTEAGDVRRVMEGLVSVGEDLGLRVYADTWDGNNEVTRDNLEQFVLMFQSGSRAVIGAIGKVTDEPT